MDRKFGWIKDKDDKRDFPFSSMRASVDISKLPKKIDMRAHMTAIEDQGNIGSCVANALVGALEYLYVYKVLGRRWSCWKKKDRPHDYSRLFVYYFARDYSGWANEDNGSYIREGIRSMRNEGVCKERYWPYNIDKWSNKPNEKSRKKANNRRIKDYFRINTFGEFLTALSNDLPVTFGMVLFESFMSSSVAEHGMVSIPVANEKVMGGHAMLAVGYDVKRQLVIVRNSWGSNWGDNGYCYIPFSIMSEIGGTVDDCWVIRTHPYDN